MKKFRPTLQSIRGVCERQQKKEKLILRKFQLEAALISEQILETEQKRRAALETFAKRLECGERFDPLEMELNAKYLMSLVSQERAKKQELALKKQACEHQSQRA